MRRPGLGRTRTPSFWSRGLAVGLALSTSTAWAADDGVSVVGTRYSPFEAEVFEGSEYRARLAEAFRSRADGAARWTALQPALEFCEGKKDSSERTWVSVSTQAERDELIAARADASRLAFLDIACPRAYGMAAYFAAEEGDTGRAIAWLDRAHALAPFSAAPLTERAFLHNAAGDRQQALASYRRALDLAERYPSSASEKPIALRGIGWTLIELGDFAGAREAYEASLVADPGNPSAIAELAAIGRLENQGGVAPATAPFHTRASKGTALDPELPADKAKVIEWTRLLESQPLHPQAAQMRGWVMTWVSDSPDVSVVACNTLELLEDETLPHGEALFVQSLFGAAVYLIEHPGEQDPLLAQQLAGAESTLRAYSAMLREHPDARVANLDALLRDQAAGKLKTTMERLVAEHCTE